MDSGAKVAIFIVAYLTDLLGNLLMVSAQFALIGKPHAYLNAYQQMKDTMLRVFIRLGYNSWPLIQRLS